MAKHTFHFIKLYDGLYVQKEIFLGPWQPCFIGKRLNKMVLKKCKYSDIHYNFTADKCVRMICKIW